MSTDLDELRAFRADTNVDPHARAEARASLEAAIAGRSGDSEARSGGFGLTARRGASWLVMGMSLAVVVVVVAVVVLAGPHAPGRQQPHMAGTVPASARPLTRILAVLARRPQTPADSTRRSCVSHCRTGGPAPSGLDAAESCSLRPATVTPRARPALPFPHQPLARAQVEKLPLSHGGVSH